MALRRLCIHQINIIDDITHSLWRGARLAACHFKIGNVWLGQSQNQRDASLHSPFIILLVNLILTISIVDTALFLKRIRLPIGE
jgi:hypothetical protein